MIASSVQPPLRDRLSELMAEARADDQHDRRGAARYPFFRQVNLEQVDTGPLDCVAFTREISMVSLGLLHSAPLIPGWLTVVIPRSQGEPLRLAAEIVWCRPCGDGWYLSGGLLHGVE